MRQADVKVLITGAKGQLGQEFQKLFDELGIAYIPTHHTAYDHYEVLDIINHGTVLDVVKGRGITHIINCAAYNDVDRAEQEHEKAYALNSHAPELLAQFAQEEDVVLATFSTDFVFAGDQHTPYKETDIAQPVNTYGASKLAGEKAVLTACDKIFVIRTSWVYGVGNHNFNKSLLTWSQSRTQLTIVDDQVSTPTYAKDLAAYSWDLIASAEYGLYHLSNRGHASKYDQAKYVLDRVEWEGKLRRGKTSDFDLAAPRAEYTALDCSKAEAIIGRQMPHWRDAIDRFLNEMKERGDC